MTLVLNSPPGPKGHWLTGCLAEFRRGMLPFLTRIAHDYGPVASFRVGHRRHVLLTHPDPVERVLVTDNRDYAKHYVLQMLRPTLGNGLLLSEGEFWLRQRRMMQPAFHRSRLEAHADTMVDLAKRMADGWQDGETLDLHAEMMHLTLSIVARVLMDVDLDDGDGEIGAGLDLMMHEFSARFEGLIPPPSWLPTPRQIRLRRSRRRLDALIDGIVRQRRLDAGGRGDLLSTLVRARDEGGDQTGMTDRQLRDEVMTLILAGHETTANALAWTWFLLAQHPDVESKLHAELNEVLGGREPTAADLPRLAYAERVITESMRLYPPVYTFGRKALRDVTLGGFAIPAGMTVLMSQWVIHRDPQWFDRPEEFDPDRWAGGLAGRLPKYAYFPFGGGPRGCIGNTFAMMEAVLVLATVARRWRFALDPNHAVEPWPSVTLRPAGGIRAAVMRRASDPLAIRTGAMN